LTFETYTGNSYYKDFGIKWLLLGGIDELKRENDSLKLTNYQLVEKCENYKASKALLKETNISYRQRRTQTIMGTRLKAIAQNIRE
jgi:FtsZ-binding cell division protein ZapB